MPLAGWAWIWSKCTWMAAIWLRNKVRSQEAKLEGRWVWKGPSEVPRKEGSLQDTSLLPIIWHHDNHLGGFIGFCGLQVLRRIIKDESKIGEIAAFISFLIFFFEDPQLKYIPRGVRSFFIWLNTIIIFLKDVNLMCFERVFV